MTRQRPSFFVLCAGLIVVTALFAVRATYGRATYWALALGQATVICIAAWRLGARASRSGEPERRTLALAGALLISPWSLFALLPGVATPWVATHAENQLRYLLLLIGAIAIGSGWIVLRDALRAAGERFHSTIGFAAIVLATPLYLVWAAMLLDVHHELERAGPGEVPEWIRSLANLSDVLLFFGGALTYAATAAFATSLGRAGLLGRGAARACAFASTFGLLCVVVRGPRFPDPYAATVHWHSIPGFVAGIPAVPWIAPCLIGIAMLRRAGDAQR